MKVKGILSIIMLFVLTLTVLTGCTNDSGASSSSAEGNSTGSNGDSVIAIIVPAADHGWLAGVAYFAEQKCAELGLSKDNYRLLTSNNVNEQTNQIEEMINLKVTAVVLQPHNDEVSVSAQKIIDANIPLVVFDRKVDVDYTAFVAGDNSAMGAESAKYIGKELNGKGTIAIYNVPSSGSVSVERVNAFKEVMGKDYPDIKLVDLTAADFTQQEGLNVGADALTANPSLDAIFSIDDESSIGLLGAIKEAKRTDIKYLSGGGGANDYYEIISSETQPECFTATYSPKMIQDAVQTAVDIIDGKSVGKEIVVPPSIVTKENASNFLDEKSPY